jgi:hypothetical protein
MRFGGREIGALVLALAVGGLLFALLDGPNQPSRCADGWRSPSIGETGACSHHGGVVPGRDPTPWWKRALPIGVGLVIFLVPAWRNGAFRRETHDPMAAFTDPVSMEIRQAMKEGSDVHFLYKIENQALQWRTVTPLELTHLHRASHASRCLLAYCHLRQAKRHFVISRMSEVTRVAAVRS